MQSPASLIMAVSGQGGGADSLSTFSPKDYILYCWWKILKLFAFMWSVHFLSGCFKFPLSSIWPIQLCMISFGSGNSNSWGQLVGINQLVGSALCRSMSSQPCCCPSLKNMSDQKILPDLKKKNSLDVK